MSLHISVIMRSTVTLCCITRVRPHKITEKLQVYMLGSAVCLSPRARCLAIILRNNIFEKPEKVRQSAPMEKPAIKYEVELKEDALLCASALREFGSDDYLMWKSSRRLWLCCP